MSRQKIALVSVVDKTGYHISKLMLEELRCADTDELLMQLHRRIALLEKENNEWMRTTRAWEISRISWELGRRGVKSDPGTELTKGEKARIRHLLKGGYKQQEIARELGRHRNTIGTYIRLLKKTQKT